MEHRLNPIGQPYFEFYQSNDNKPLKDIQGVSPMVRALLGGWILVTFDETSRSITLWGPPGAGKSTVAETLSTILLGCGVDVFRVYCSRIAELSLVEKMKLLRDLKRDYISRSSQLLIILDESDAVFHERPNSSLLHGSIPSDNDPVWWLTELLSGKSNMLVVLITNKPSNVDSALRSRTNYYLYQPFSHDKDIETFLKTQVAHYKHVTEMIIREFAPGRPTIRGLHVSIKTVKTLCQKKYSIRFEKLPDFALANAIYRHCGDLIRPEDVDSYENDHHVLKLRSTMHLKTLLGVCIPGSSICMYCFEDLEEPIATCPKCGFCYHAKCYNMSSRCPRCEWRRTC